MPFIVDLPPPDYRESKTRIEHLDKSLTADVNGPNFDALKLDNDLIEQVYLNNKFAVLVSSWLDNTRFESSISRIIDDRNFIQIVSMGRKAIPLIINEIEARPSVLVWALNFITESTVSSNRRLTIDEVSKKWVKLYRTGKIKIK